MTAGNPEAVGLKGVGLDGACLEEEGADLFDGLEEEAVRDDGAGFREPGVEEIDNLDLAGAEAGIDDEEARDGELVRGGEGEMETVGEGFIGGASFFFEENQSLKLRASSPWMTCAFFAFISL